MFYINHFGGKIMPRNPERIEPLLEELGHIWKTQCPDLRLGQLLWFIAEGDPFNIEDYATLKALAKKFSVSLDLSALPEEFIPNFGG